MERDKDGSKSHHLNHVLRLLLIQNASLRQLKTADEFLGLQSLEKNRSSSFFSEISRDGQKKRVEEGEDDERGKQALSDVPLHIRQWDNVKKNNADDRSLTMLGPAEIDVHYFDFRGRHEFGQKEVPLEVDTMRLPTELCSFHDLFIASCDYWQLPPRNYSLTDKYGRLWPMQEQVQVELGRICCEELPEIRVYPNAYVESLKEAMFEDIQRQKEEQQGMRGGMSLQEALKQLKKVGSPQSAVRRQNSSMMSTRLSMMSLGSTGRNDAEDGNDKGGDTREIHEHFFEDSADVPEEFEQQRILQNRVNLGRSNQALKPENRQALREAALFFRNRRKEKRADAVNCCLHTVFTLMLLMTIMFVLDAREMYTARVAASNTLTRTRFSMGDIPLITGATTVRETGAELTFDEISNWNEWWKWIDIIFVPTVLPEQMYTGKAYYTDTGNKSLFLAYNRLIGGIRFRQVRVQRGTWSSCYDNTDTSVGSCYGLYTIGNADTSDMTLPTTCQSTFSEWCQAFLYSQPSTKDWLYTLPNSIVRFFYDEIIHIDNGGGHIYDFNIVSSESQADQRLRLETAMSNLKSQRWIDSQTRAVEVELVAVAQQLSGMLVRLKFSLEKTPSGRLRPTHSEWALQAKNIVESTSVDWESVLRGIVFFVMIIATSIYATLYLVFVCNTFWMTRSRDTWLARVPGEDWIDLLFVDDDLSRISKSHDPEDSVRAPMIQQTPAALEIKPMKEDELVNDGYGSYLADKVYKPWVVSVLGTVTSTLEAQKHFFISIFSNPQVAWRNFWRMAINFLALLSCSRLQIVAIAVLKLFVEKKAKDQINAIWSAEYVDRSGNMKRVPTPKRVSALFMIITREILRFLLKCLHRIRWIFKLLNTWNFIDFLLIGFLLSFLVNFMTLQLGAVFDGIDIDSTSFKDVSLFAFSQNDVNNTIGVAWMLSLLKYFRYFHHSIRFRVVWTTLNFASPELRSFLLLSILLYLAVGFWAYLTFGPWFLHMSAPSLTLASFFQMTLGEFEEIGGYRGLESANQWIAPIFTVVFLVVGGKIITSAVFAIMLDSLMKAKAVNEKELALKARVAESGTKIKDDFADLMADRIERTRFFMKVMPTMREISSKEGLSGLLNSLITGWPAAKAIDAAYASQSEKAHVMVGNALRQLMYKQLKKPYLYKNNPMIEQIVDLKWLNGEFDLYRSHNFLVRLKDPNKVYLRRDAEGSIQHARPPSFYVCVRPLLYDGSTKQFVTYVSELRRPEQFFKESHVLHVCIHPDAMTNEEVSKRVQTFQAFNEKLMVYTEGGQGSLEAFTLFAEDAVHSNGETATLLSFTVDEKSYREHRVNLEEYESAADSLSMNIIEKLQPFYENMGYTENAFRKLEKDDRGLPRTLESVTSREMVQQEQKIKSWKDVEVSLLDYKSLRVHEEATPFFLEDIDSIGNDVLLTPYMKRKIAVLNARIHEAETNTHRMVSGRTKYPLCYYCWTAAKYQLREDVFHFLLYCGAGPYESHRVKYHAEGVEILKNFFKEAVTLNLEVVSEKSAEKKGDDRKVEVEVDAGLAHESVEGNRGDDVADENRSKKPTTHRVVKFSEKSRGSKRDRAICHHIGGVFFDFYRIRSIYSSVDKKDIAILEVNTFHEWMGLGGGRYEVYKSLGIKRYTPDFALKIRMPKVSRNDSSNVAGVITFVNFAWGHDFEMHKEVVEKELQEAFDKWRNKYFDRLTGFEGWQVMFYPCVVGALGAVRPFTVEQAVKLAGLTTLKKPEHSSVSQELALVENAPNITPVETSYVVRKLFWLEKIEKSAGILHALNEETKKYEDKETRKQKTLGMTALRQYSVLLKARQTKGNRPLHNYKEDEMMSDKPKDCHVRS